MDMEERLQKIIAAAGLASRRKAEILIQEGRVSLNGRVVKTLGTKADPNRDHIKVDGKLIRRFPEKVYVLLNKPRQVISSVADPRGRTKVIDLVKVQERLYPVGRLDYKSEGLILLTNDGEFSRIVSCAGKYFPRIYEVKVQSSPEPASLKRLRSGIHLPDGVRLAPCRIVSLKEGNNCWFEVTLTQGKNQQIRKMFEAVGHSVLKLRRRRIGFFTDQGLPVGRYRFVSPREIARVLRIGQTLRKASLPEDAEPME